MWRIPLAKTRYGELLAARGGLRPAADLVWQHLDRSVEPWLLVLDNADEPEILRDGSWLRTSPRGTVVVTTRRSAARWWPGAELQHIGVLPREDAARVLQDLAPHRGTQQEADRIAIRILGPDHTVTLGARHNRAWTLYRLGRFDAAERETRLVTEAYLRRFGPDYPITLSARQLLSRTHVARGRLAAGIEIMTDVLARRERSLGADHPFTVAGRELLGDFTSRRGRTGTASS